MSSYYRHFGIILTTLAISSAVSGQLAAQNIRPELRFAQAQTSISSQKAKADELVEQANQLNQDAPAALKNLEQALKIYRQISDQANEVRTLEKIQHLYFLVGRYSDTLDSLNQARKIYQELHDTSGEARILGHIGWSYYFLLGDKPKAFEAYNQSLALYKKLGNLSEQSYIYSQLGWAYYGVDKYQDSLTAYNQALVLAHEVKDQSAEAYALIYISQPYTALGRQQEAIDSLAQARAIYKALKLPSEEARVLRHLCGTYREFNKNQLATDACNQATSLYVALGDYVEAGYVTRELGLLYHSIGEATKALETLNQSLAFRRKVGEKGEEARVLSDIGYVLQASNKPELAITFYKEAVNIREKIRKDLRKLSVEEQKLYTETIASTYRALADLLLSQGRVLEAQRVLELLKVQEIQLYTREASAGQDGSGIAANDIEKQVLQTHGTLIAFGQKVDQCQQTQCSELSQLLDKRDVLRDNFERTVTTLGEQIRKNRHNDDDATNPNKVFGNPDEIVSAQPGTVLIYTLVLPDKLWVLWASKGGITKSIEVPSAGQEKLSHAVFEYRQLLQNPESDLKDVQAKGKQLYDWLIPPKLQAELKANDVRHLVFSLDHVTRYVPMGALFDGKQYLIERYTTSTIISDRTDTRDRLPPGVQNTSVLALGLTKETSGFKALPNVLTELNQIVREFPTELQGIYPGIKRFDDKFTWRALRDNITHYQILHIATHGKFEPGNASASFIVLGDGQLPIPKIKELVNLGNLHLVVLSACETALGGSGQDGIEVSAISSYFLDRGAKAVLASLWAVNDASTSQLMRQFYTNLSAGKMGKAEALRQAQISLITGKYQSQSKSDRSSVIFPDGQGSGHNSISHDLSHPYYWAPFILIGNGL
jgi:CHAT domain-containing protein/tetratricopeptide (TPR) repeat protein